MYIFTPAGNAFSTKSTHDQKWITIDTDLLQLMREGLENAWRDNFLKESQSLADYRIAAINIGWEVPGTFDVDLAIRRLSLRTSSTNFENRGRREE